VSQLRQTLLTCLTDCPDAVVIDLAGLTTFDKVALAVFRGIWQRAAVWPAVPVLLCAAPPALAASLARTGTDKILPVLADLPAALAAATGPATVARIDREFMPSVTAPAEARNMITEVCWAWRLPEQVGPATVIISELVTNAVTHATGTVRVTAVLRHPYLHLVVRDGDPAPPRPQPVPVVTAGRLATSGRGLHVLEAAAQGWGYLCHGTGKVVWARLRYA
jgi:anti-anti-sigma regulatory factor